jgi:hypothetical protein
MQKKKAAKGDLHIGRCKIMKHKKAVKRIRKKTL